MSLLYRVLAYVGLAAIVFAAGVKFGYDYLSNKVEAERVASLEQSRATEQKWQEDFNLNARNLTHEINRIAVARDDLLKRLRDRENVSGLSQDSGIDCPRPDWRTIPAEMGAEVIREVAERDTYREGLIACYRAMDSLR